MKFKDSYLVAAWALAILWVMFWVSVLALFLTAVSGLTRAEFSFWFGLMTCGVGISVLGMLIERLMRGPK